MDEVTYKPNSHKYKERQKTETEEKEKRAEKVVQGKVKLKKKNEVRKFADVFVAEDTNNVKEYLLMEVAIPAIKNTIIDLITNGINMLLNGETRSSSSRKRSGDYISYRDYSSRDRDRRDRHDSASRGRFDFDDLVFDSRNDAEATLEQMDDIIERYGMATVLDLYESADLGRSAPWTANRYGWSSLRSADIIKVRDGYVIKLPKAMPID